MTNQTESTEPEANSDLAGQNERLVMRYQHDCSCCKPLGQWLRHDIYFCDAAGDTVVARYGNKGEEYMSGIHLTGMPAIKVAVAMAKAANLIDA